MWEKRGVTVESLDFYRQRRWVTAEQHWAGVYYRWLYTVCFGLSGAQNDYTGLISGRPSADMAFHPKYQDQAWRDARQREYNDIVTLLRKRHVKVAVNDVCLFDKMLGQVPTKEGGTTPEIDRLKYGLDLLADYFARKGLYYVSAAEEMFDRPE